MCGHTSFAQTEHLHVRKHVLFVANSHLLRVPRVKKDNTPGCV